MDEGGITATKLYTTNQNVDDINVRCLKKIDKQSIFYDANDTGSEPFLSQLRKSMLLSYVFVATRQELCICQCEFACVLGDKAVN